MKPIICLPSPSGEAGIIEYLMEENMVYKPLSEGSLTKLFGWNIFIDLFLSECVSVTKWINKRVLIWRLPRAICKYFFMVSVCFKLLRGFAKGKTFSRIPRGHLGIQWLIFQPFSLYYIIIVESVQPKTWKQIYDSFIMFSSIGRFIVF